MKFLLIDAGNTSIKYALCVPKDRGSIVTVLKQSEIADHQFDQVIVSNVSGRDVKKFLSDLNTDQSFGYSENQYIEAKVSPNAFGIKCAYEQYQNLGIDRWCAILGAEKRHPNKNLIIIDSGTATTVDFLTKDKVHFGGWIVPGLQLMQSSIVEKAPLVFSAKNVEKEYIGTNTPSALLSGCTAAQKGLIQQALLEFKKVIQSGDILIVITGGAAQCIAENTELNCVVESDLIFHGLSRFAQ